MPKITIPTKCVKCDSEKIRHEELAMGGRHGVVAGRGYRFDVYICEECGYSEFFFKERTLWVWIDTQLHHRKVIAETKN